MYNAAVNNGLSLSYSLTTITPGLFYRFKVAAANGLGVGPYSAPALLLAADAPVAPVLSEIDSERTLSSVFLQFTPDANDGGSSIIGYVLYGNQGIAGSPFSLIYNGTGRPEVIFYNVTNLTTGLTYQFYIQSENLAF